jgi:hypothetical protein
MRNPPKSQYGETTQKNGVEIQIDTKQNRLLSRLAIGSLLKPGEVHRTLLGVDIF